jgi:hypothetical protein
MIVFIVAAVAISTSTSAKSGLSLSKLFVAGYMMDEPAEDILAVCSVLDCVEDMTVPDFVGNSRRRVSAASCTNADVETTVVNNRFGSIRAGPSVFERDFLGNPFEINRHDFLKERGFSRANVRTA